MFLFSWYYADSVVTDVRIRMFADVRLVGFLHLQKVEVADVTNAKAYNSAGLNTTIKSVIIALQSSVRFTSDVFPP
jgi:hypothetical protein